MSRATADDVHMTLDEFLEELARLEGRFVAVAFHPARSWNPVLHIQGELHRDELDDGPGVIAYSIGREPPHPDAPWKRSGPIEHASFDVLPNEIETIEWRDDLVPAGSRVIAVAIREGSMLTITPF